MVIRDAVLFFVLGAALGGLLVGLLMIQRLRAASSRLQQGAESVIKLAHDVRGAVTPALLMTERLQLHSDDAVRQAAAVMASAMERAADLAKAASAEARAAGGVARRR